MSETFLEKFDNQTARVRKLKAHKHKPPAHCSQIDPKTNQGQVTKHYFLTLKKSGQIRSWRKPELCQFVCKS